MEFNAMRELALSVRNAFAQSSDKEIIFYCREIADILKLFNNGEPLYLTIAGLREVVENFKRSSPQVVVVPTASEGGAPLSSTSANSESPFSPVVLNKEDLKLERSDDRQALLDEIESRRERCRALERENGELKDAIHAKRLLACSIQLTKSLTN